MSYNYPVLFKKYAVINVNIEQLTKAITSPKEVSSAFFWRETKQGIDFWEGYATLSKNQKEGKAILRAFLNLDEIKLEDLI